MPGLGAKNGTAFRQDLLINRPVAEPSLEGFFFFALDDNLGTLYQCNGTGWVPITGGLRGLVAGPGISLVNTPSTITINNAYTLPIATSSILGGIKVGSGLAIDGSGILSTTVYTLPIASSIVLGGIKVGSGLSIDGGGVLSSSFGGEGVEHGGTLVGTRPTINFIDGSNVTLTVSDNGGSSRVDVTIAAAGGGGGGLSLYQTTVMADTPIGFWPLTEQGTTVGAVYADISGNSRDVAVRVGTLTHVEGITAGTTAPYLGDPDVDGISDALWTNNTVGLPINNQAYTLEGWIQPSPNAGFDYNLGFATLAWIAYGKPNNVGVIIGSDFRSSEWTSGAGDNVLKLKGQSNASGSTQAVLHAPLGTGTWHHVVVSDNAAGRIKMYVDGYLVLNYGSAGTSNGLVYNVLNVLFFGDPGLVSGTYPAPLAEEFAGAISHYAIYNYPLTDAQVLKHFMVAKNTSDSTDLVPNVMAYSGNLSTTIPSNSNIAVPLANTHWDNGSPTPQHDNSVNNTQLTCTEDGLYRVSGRLNWATGNPYDGFFTARIWKNRFGIGTPFVGTVAETMMYVNGNPSNSIVQYVSGEVRLAIGDYVELIASQLSNSSVDRFLNSADGKLFDYTQSRLHMSKIG